MNAYIRGIIAAGIVLVILQIAFLGGSSVNQAGAGVVTGDRSSSTTEGTVAGNTTPNMNGGTNSSSTERGGVVTGD